MLVCLCPEKIKLADWEVHWELSSHLENFDTLYMFDSFWVFHAAMNSWTAETLVKSECHNLILPNFPSPVSFPGHFLSRSKRLPQILSISESTCYLPTQNHMVILINW